MARFLIVWSVFSVRKWSAQLSWRYRPLTGYGQKAVRRVMRFTPMPLLLLAVRALCRLRLLGRQYRGRSAVATQNYRCLTGVEGRIDAGWIAMRRQLLETGATWGQHPATLAQMQACTRELDAVVAPLAAQKTPVVLAPLHCVSDILAAMVGAGVTPGKASVVVSSSAESYTVASRKMGGVALSYCSIHQDNTSLASELMALMTNVSAGRENMIIFPDIPADYTVQTPEAQSGKISCRIFGRPAKLHSGVQRFSRIVSAQVVFYHLYYQHGIKIKIYSPLRPKEVAAKWLPFSALKKEISGYALILEESPGAIAGPDPVITGAQQEMPRTMSLKETAAVPGIYKLMLLTFLVSLTLFLMPTMVSRAINQAFSDVQNTQFPYLWFILAFVVSTLLALGVRVISERFIRRFVLLKSDIGFSRLLNNPLRFFEKRAPGDVFSRFIAWQGGMLQKIELDNGLRSDWIICVIAIGIMFWISPVLALISAVGIVAMGLISVWAIFRDRWYTQQLQLKSATLNDFFMETLQGVLTIKTAGLETQRKAQFARLSHDLFTCLQRQKVYQQVKEGLYQLTGSLEMVVFMLVVLPLVHAKLISLGDFFAYSFLRQIFTSYVTRIFYAVIRKSQLHVIDTRAQGLFTRHEPAAPQFAPLSGEAVPRLTFEQVSFHYNPQRPVLNAVDLILEPGDRLAIVGDSGAGKSTLLRLMAGLFSAQHGRILLNNDEVSAQQLASQVWLQSQEDILFNASVLQNITLFDPWYSDSALFRPASAADAGAGALQHPAHTAVRRTDRQS